MEGLEGACAQHVRSWSVSQWSSAGECRDDLTKACDRQTARIQDAITNKRVTFDSKIMNDCLESILAPSDTCASVDMMAPWVDACMDSAWGGAVADGGMYQAGFECCTSSSTCKSGQCLPGTCPHALGALPKPPTN